MPRSGSMTVDLTRDHTMRPSPTYCTSSTWIYAPWPRPRYCQRGALPEIVFIRLSFVFRLSFCSFLFDPVPVLQRRELLNTIARRDGRRSAAPPSNQRPLLAGHHDSAPAPRSGSPGSGAVPGPKRRRHSVIRCDSKGITTAGLQHAK